MIKHSTADYDWDEALAHIELMGHTNVGLTQIAAFRPGNFDERNYLGVFEPGNYGVAIDDLRRLQRQDSTLSFYVGINPLVDAALPYAANQDASRKRYPGVRARPKVALRRARRPPCECAARS
jgi:hypothetical protein